MKSFDILKIFFLFFIIKYIIRTRLERKRHSQEQIDRTITCCHCAKERDINSRKQDKFELEHELIGDEPQQINLTQGRKGYKQRVNLWFSFNTQIKFILLNILLFNLMISFCIILHYKFNIKQNINYFYIIILSKNRKN